ncbi:MAG: hypothetical protein ABII02_03790 [Candidatus Magasanikbacteria bacterium]
MICGFIRGWLYRVTDYTEPNGVYSYPLAVLCESGHLISATFNTFDTSEKEFNNIQDKLTEFEGSLYEQVEVHFHDSIYTKRKGLIFVAKKDIDIYSMPHIQKIDPVDGVCVWRSSVCF